MNTNIKKELVFVNISKQLFFQLGEVSMQWAKNFQGNVKNYQKFLHNFFSN